MLKEKGLQKIELLVFAMKCNASCYAMTGNNNKTDSVNGM